MDQAIIDLYKSRANITASAYFPSLNLTLEKEIKEESPEIVDGIISGNNLKFGECMAASIKLVLIGVESALSGQTFEYYHHIGGYDVLIGTFVVNSVKKQDNKLYSDLLAYDCMRKIDTDVATWYISLFPTGNETYTLAQFRASFLTFVGITEDTSKLPLPNDNMTVPKTIDTPESLSGRMVIEAIEELNGAFGHIGRDGKFTHKILAPAYGLYPSVTLYPSATLYPVSATDTNHVNPSLVKESITAYESVKFEEYTVKEIDKLVIRQEEGDVGAVVGTGTNAYIIQGNFLVYGKSAAELAVIAQNAFGNMAKRPYRPFESDNIGLPYIEVGDAVQFATDTPVISYVLSRTLKGIQALTDEYSAKGSEVQVEQVSGTNYEIKQLKGKTAKIVEKVEQVSASVSDLDIQLTGEINVLAGQVVLKVTSSGAIAVVELDADPSTGTTIKLSADNIELEGLVTANSNFKILADGSIEAVNGKFNGNITGGTIVIDNPTSSNILKVEEGKTTGTLFETRSYNDIKNETMADGYGMFGYGTLYLLSSNPGYTSINGGYAGFYSVSCTTLNGGTPITSSNIGSQSVSYATDSGSTDSVSYGGNLGLFTISLNGGYISYNGANKDNQDGYVYVGAKTLQAGTIQQISLRESKDKIELFEKSAIELICNTPIHTYVLKDNEEDSKTHVGVLIDEAPEEIIGAGGTTVSLYDMISLGWKGEQEIIKRLLKIEESLDKNGLL